MPVKDKGALYGAFFSFVFVGSNGEKLISDEDRSVARHAYASASHKINALHDNEKIGPDDCGMDNIENFDKMIEKALIKFVKVFEYFKNSRKVKHAFQEDFEDWAQHCNLTISRLRNIADFLRTVKSSNNSLLKFGSTAATVGGLLALTFPVCPPLGFLGIFNSVTASTFNAIVTIDEVREVKGKLKEAVDLLEDEKKRYSAMRWFSCSEEEKEAISSLVDSQILKQMAQRVENFRKLTDTKDMSEDEFKTHYENVLGYCMDLMAEDRKLISEFGKELAPVVMTYVFVVCLMDDHNRIKLDHSLKTLDLMNSLKVGMSGLAIGAVAFQSIAGLISGLLGIAMNVLLAAFNFIDSCRGPDTEYTRKIDEAADKIEEIFTYIERVYDETKKHKSHDPVAEWKSIVVKETPVDAGSDDLKKAVKVYLPEAARGRIKLLKLTTHEWLVFVPACHSQRLLQQTQFTVKGKSCGIAR